MTIPSFDITHLTNPDGTPTERTKLFFDQLISFLQSSLSPEGNLLPQQNATNIALLNTTRSIARILYNSTTNKAMINENGTYKTITTS